jgi:hypothetical protein
MKKRMKRTISKFPVIMFEFAAAYGALGYLKLHEWIYDGLFYLILSFFCLVFSLYYGLKGACVSVIVSVFLIHLTIREDILSFLSLHYLETSFLMGAILITGFVKSGMEKKILGSKLVNEIMNQRMERLTIELSEKDKALQDTFRDILVDMESPRIMYQTIRRLEYIEDRQTLFNEILYMLYTHCHVEKSSIYKPLTQNRFEKVAGFGASTLPDILKWKEEKMPEIMRVTEREREVIVPTRHENRFIMALPILSSSGNLLYIILIEEIRFINMNDALLNLLKAAAFWMKNIIENHFHREEFLSVSAFESVIVYRKNLYKKALKKSIAFHKNYGLPFACLRIQGNITEENCKRLGETVRIHDEFFMASDDVLIVVLTMITENHVPFVIQRIRSALPELEISSEANIASLYG